MRIVRLGALGAVLAIALGACTPGPGAGGRIEGTQWVLGAYLADGALVTVDEALYADATFERSRLRGFAGCNEFRALYRAPGRSLTVSQSVPTTLLTCDEATTAFDAAYRQLLDSSRWYGVYRGQLTIYDGTREPVLVFDAAPRNPLLGEWRVTAYGIPPGTVVEVADDPALDAAFGIASVGGFAGCNTYRGTYGTNGDIVRIGALATTQLACEDIVMAQEAAFLEALSQATRIEARGSTLQLTDRQDSPLVTLVRPWALEASASPAPEPTEEPTGEPTEEPTEKPTKEPTEEPTKSPKPSPTPAPSEAPTPTAEPEPTLGPTPPASVPPTFPPSASCELGPLEGPAVATLVYPGTWFTLEEPADAACRYFDPEPITPPEDPPAVDLAAVRAEIVDVPYEDVVDAASDPDGWTVQATSAFIVGEAVATCLVAVAAGEAAEPGSTEEPGSIAPGTAVTSCFVDVGSAGTVAIWATADTADGTFAIESGVVMLMTLASTFAPAP